MVTVKKAVSLAALIAAAILLVVCGVWIFMASPLLEVGACDRNSKTVGWPAWAVFIAAGVAAFVLGNLLGHWRDLSNELFEHEPHGREGLTEELTRTDDRYRRRAWTVQLLLAGCLTVVTALLAYETWAVWNGSPWWAITDFVRCASIAATPQTLVASTALLFLAGHWLWHPLRRDQL